MKVGDMVYYITNGKLHYGEVIYKDRETQKLFIREKKHVTKILESRVAREVSNECKGIGENRTGSPIVSKSCDSSNNTGVARCTSLEKKLYEGGK